MKLTKKCSLCLDGGYTRFVSKVEYSFLASSKKMKKKKNNHDMSTTQAAQIATSSCCCRSNCGYCEISNLMDCVYACVFGIQAESWSLKLNVNI